MFADDTSLKTSDKDTDTVQNELQRSINEASDWCDNNAMILHPAKTKSSYLLLGKNISFARFTLILVLKTVILNKFMSTGTLALFLMMNLAGDHTLLAFVKQFQKIFICCHSSDTLWTLLSANLFYHAHISSHLTYASTVWDGCSDILFNKLNSLHRRAAKLMISDSSLSTDTKLRYLGILPLKEKLMFNKAVLVFKAYKNLAPPYLKQLFICSNIRATSRYIAQTKNRSF